MDDKSFFEKISKDVTLYIIGFVDIQTATQSINRINKWFYNLYKDRKVIQRLLDQGRAYTFGGGSKCNVGIPQLIPFPLPVTQISCGACHTAFITLSGDAYAFGTGLYGKLGGSSGDTSYHFVRIPHLISQPNKVTQISCG